MLKIFLIGLLGVYLNVLWILKFVDREKVIKFYLDIVNCKRVLYFILCFIFFLVIIRIFKKLLLFICLNSY